MRKIIALILCLMLTNLAVATIPTMADDPHSVYGYLYIDGIIAPSGVDVKLSFPGGDETDITSETGYYQIDFDGHDWEEGYFYVYYNGFWYVPVGNPSVEIYPDIVGYNIDLHIETIPNPDFVYVDDDYNESTPGWGYDHFDSIQDGIDAVDENGTVYVYNGTYYENVVVNKTINLIGEDRNNTIIDGGGSGDVVYICADWVNISGFMIQHSGGNTVDAGIEIHSNYNYIGGNNILDNSMGIKLDSTNNNIISDNNISSNNWIGIYLLHESMSNILSDNILSYNNDGIYLLYSYNNTISGNIIRLNNDYGISLSDSTGNIISYNLVSGNTFDPLNNHGVQLYKSSENNISFNDINSNSRNGIWFHSSHNNTIINNIISSNNNYGIYIENITGHPAPPSNNNTIYHNNFINNTENSYDECGNTWDNDYPSGGNYWDDYVGDDFYNGPNQDILGPDGIGDISYNISGGSNQDLFPLIYPWGEMPPIANFSYEINDLRVTFDPMSSFDRDGEIDYVIWNFGEPPVMQGPLGLVNHTYSSYGDYDVTLTVVDDDGYEGNITKTITLDDFVSPEIIDNTPTEGYTGDPFTFNATITDVGGIDSVWVTWWYDSTAVSVELDYMGDDYYEKTITIQDTLDIMHYFIDATDTSNNSQSTGTKHVTIYDNDLPEISNVQADPPAQWRLGNINVSAMITDNIEVDEVYLHIEYPDSIIGNLNLRQRNTKNIATKRGTIENFSITQNKTGDTYYCNKTYDYPGIYDYHIWTNDTSGNTNVSVDYTFEIINQPPYLPSNPNPYDGATDVPIVNLTLIWSGGDPDVGDILQYDVYFGDIPNPPFFIGILGVPYNQTPIEFELYNHYELEYDTTYFWKIKARDNHGASTEGPIWSFTTEFEPVPDLDCSGTLSWTGVTPSATVNGTFTVENDGEVLSLLDWGISECPTWGDWTFTPDSGTCLEEGDTVTIDVEVVAPDDPETEFTGEVILVNSDDPGDTCTIDVSLATPVSQFQSNQQIPRFMQSIIERYPILRQVLGL